MTIATANKTQVHFAEAAEGVSTGWFAELERSNAQGVVGAWQAHDDLLRGDTVDAWLHSVGGLSMEKIQTQFELVVAADRAPNDLLFGLAHGKLADALASRAVGRSPAHHVDLSQGELSPLHEEYLQRVLARGHEHASSLDEKHPEFFEAQVLGQSRDNREDLIAQAIAAPHAFILGEMTSWVIANYRSHNPDQYQYVLTGVTTGVPIDEQTPSTGEN